MWNFIVWIFFGLIVGAIAKLLVPGPNPSGCLITIALGVIGSLVGGFIGRAIGLYGDEIHAAGFFMSILGAIVVLLIYGWFTKRSGPGPG